MKVPSFLKTFRGQLILSLLFTVLLVLGFSFYIFTETGEMSELSDRPVHTIQDLKFIETEIQHVRKASFLLIASIVTLGVGLFINLIMGLSYSLKTILSGIEAIDRGELSSRIDLQSENEFGTIAQFLNKAAEHLDANQKQLLDSKASIERQVVQRTEELQTEKNKLSLTLANTTDGVIAIDLQGNISLFNEAAARITGYHESEVVGKSIQNLLTITADESAVPFSVYCSTESSLFIKNDAHLRGNHGLERYVNITSGHITQGATANLGWILTLHDVTEEHHLEQMKLDFVSMAAHELRTPLTSIRGYLSIFLNENQNKFDTTQSMFLNRIQFSTTQLLSLIENLLSVSKIERGVFNVQAQPTDWVALVRRTSEEFVERARDKKIKLTFEEPSSPLPPVMVDSLRITEVITNLLGNALTYTREQGSVSIRLEQKDGTIITHITDTGEGIPPDALPHLFKKFFRVSGVLEQGSKGTGLGLFIAKSIIDMHKGKIWVESELNKGSTFSFSVRTAS